MTPAETPILDVSYLFRVIRRRIWIILAAVAACLVVGLVTLLLSSPRYQASTSLIIDSSLISPPGRNAVFTATSQDSPEIESQVEILRSRELLGEVVQKLGLTTRDDFLSPKSTPLGAFVNGTTTATKNFIKSILGLDVSNSADANRLQDAIETIRDDLNVRRNGITYVISLSYEANTPELAADIVNAIANTYIDERASRRQDIALKAEEWYRQRIAELNQNAIAAEEKITTFRVAPTAAGAATAQSELRALQGQAQVLRDLHDTYLQNYLNTVQQQGFPAAEVRALAAAVPPNFKSSPSTAWILIASLAVGFSLGGASAFALEAFDRRIRTREQVISAVGAPFLGTLPPFSEMQGEPAAALPKATTRRALPSSSPLQIIELSSNKPPALSANWEMTIAIDSPRSAYAETMRRIKNAFDARRQDGAAISGFISRSPLRGRSLAAINFAEMLAGMGKRTLLIDMDGHDTALTEMATHSATAGFANLTVSNIEAMLPSLIWQDERSGLHFLPNRGMGPDNPPSLDEFDTEMAETLLRRMSGYYDHIVIDLPCLEISAFAAGLSHVVTGYVVVVQWGAATAASVSEAIDGAGIDREMIVGGLLDGISPQQLRNYGSGE